jgi:hypothetical protein
VTDFYIETGDALDEFLSAETRRKRLFARLSFGAVILLVSLMLLPWLRPIKNDQDAPDVAGPAVRTEVRQVVPLPTGR